MNSLKSKCIALWNKKISLMQLYTLIGTIDAGVVAYFVHDKSRKTKEPISCATITAVAIVNGAAWPYTILLSVKHVIDETHRFLSNS